MTATRSRAWTSPTLGGAARAARRRDSSASSSRPRCGSTEAGQAHPGFEFGGFVAVRDDTPVLEEEVRFALANLLRCYPQWDGRARARYLLPTGWVADLCAEESIRWVNEWKPPKASEKHRALRDDARGFYLCPACGHILKPGDPPKSGKANKAPKGRGDADPYEHAAGCARAGQPPVPMAITTKTPATTDNSVTRAGPRHRPAGPSGIRVVSDREVGADVGFTREGLATARRHGAVGDLRRHAREDAGLTPAHDRRIVSWMGDLLVDAKATSTVRCLGV